MVGRNSDVKNYLENGTKGKWMRNWKLVGNGWEMGGKWVGPNFLKWGRNDPHKHDHFIYPPSCLFSGFRDLRIYSRPRLSVRAFDFRQICQPREDQSTEQMRLMGFDGFPNPSKPIKTHQNPSKPIKKSKCVRSFCLHWIYCYLLKKVLLSVASFATRLVVCDWYKDKNDGIGNRLKNDYIVRCLS